MDTALKLPQHPPSPTPSASASYQVRAFHVTEKLKLKDLRERFTTAPIEFSNYELILKYDEHSYLFIYNYGSAVFFNVPEAIYEREMQVLSSLLGPSDFGRTSDVFLVEVSPEATQPQPPKVYFDRLVVSALSFPHIKIASMLVAESTALEYYEILIENLLERTNLYSKRLEQKGRIAENSEGLVKFIGLCLNTKQEIISNLYIVDSPEETWENAELDKLFHDLKTMLEIDPRFRALEYKIRIIQESIEVIVDLAKSKRETVLEVTIILLIAVDLVLSLLKWKMV